MSRASADLVRDSRLETTFLSDSVRHILHISDPSRRLRLTRIEETWKRERRLGRGGFGSVWLERRTHSTNDSRAQLRAVKEITKPVANDGEEQVDYTRELEIIAKFSHPKYQHCFVSSTGWYENDEIVFIAMEYVEYGDLRSHMKQPIVEIEVRTIATQLAEALSYLHSNSFAHRDLKPNNILVVQTGPSWWVKLADFGISKRIGASMTTHTGWATEGFVAPEVLHLFPPNYTQGSSAYPFAADIWALGEIIFQLVTKRPVFLNPGELVLYVRGEHSHPLKVLPASVFTPTAGSFIYDAMAPDPSVRPTAAAILAYAWFKEGLSSAQKETEVAVFQNIDTPNTFSETYSDQKSSALSSDVGTSYSKPWTTVLPVLENHTAISSVPGSRNSIQTHETTTVSVSDTNLLKGSLELSESAARSESLSSQPAVTVSVAEDYTMAPWTTIPVKHRDAINIPSSEALRPHSVVNIPQLVPNALKLRAVINSIPPPQHLDAATAYSLVAYCQRGLTSQELINAIDITRVGNSKANAKDSHGLGTMNSYFKLLEFSDDMAKPEMERFVHFRDPATKEFLQSLPTNAILSLKDETAAHVRIAHVCIQYLLLRLPGYSNPKSLSGETAESWLAQDGFLVYAATFWAFHVRNCGTRVETIGAGVQSLIKSNEVHNARWSNFYWKFCVDHATKDDLTRHLTEFVPCHEEYIIARFDLINVLQLVKLKMPGIKNLRSMRLGKFNEHRKQLARRQIIELSHPLDFYAVDSAGDTMLHHSVRFSGSFDVFDYMYNFGIPAAVRNKSGKTVFNLAAENAHGEVPALFLLERGGDIDFKDLESENALADAARQGHLHLCKALLEKGWDTNQRGRLKRSPLHYAILHPDIIELLSTHIADLNPGDVNGVRPLHLAAEKGAASFNRLLSYAMSHDQIDTQDNKGFTPLHYAVRNKQVEHVSTLLKHGASLAIADFDGFGYRAIHHATSANTRDPEVLKLLLDHDVTGKYLETRAWGGFTAFHCASRLGGGDKDTWMACLKLLLSAGAWPSACTDQRWQPIHIAAQDVSIELLELLLQPGHSVDRNAKTKQHETALHIVLRTNRGSVESRIQFAKILLHAGVKLWRYNGQHPIHMAAGIKGAEFIKLFATLESPPPLDIPTNKGLSAVHIAAQSGNQEGVKYLIEICKVSPSPDLNGKLLKDYARESGNQATIDYVRTLRWKNG